MAKTYFANKKAMIRIPASPPHKNAEYVISVGDEVWEDGFHRVAKVQMAYDGKISGRRSPSYPVGTDDYKRVHEALKSLLENNV
jgi:hypothetical protein